jgi:hypothetical protein
MKFIVLPFLLLTAGCATVIPFQRKGSEQFGYEIKDIEAPAVFQVETTLPKSVTKRFMIFYTSRAVGETCLKRGFRFFDEAESLQKELGNSMTMITTDGYCTKENRRTGLAITFKYVGTNIVVESLNKKAPSSLIVNDVVIDIQGQKIKNISEIKRFIFNNQNLDHIDMTISRGQKTLKIKEPLVVMSEFGNTESDLNFYRQYTN